MWVPSSESQPCLAAVASILSKWSSHPCLVRPTASSLHGVDRDPGVLVLVVGVDVADVLLGEHLGHGVVVVAVGHGHVEPLGVVGLFQLDVAEVEVDEDVHGAQATCWAGGVCEADRP